MNFNNRLRAGMELLKSQIKVDCTMHVQQKQTISSLFFLLSILFLCSITGFFVMWFTEIYNDSILTSLILSQNSKAVELWKDPPLDPELRIHIFNYTNVDRYLSKEDKKLKVKDLGPYTYMEKFQKVNVTFHSNYTISYRENRTYTFVPKKSKGHEYDKITVPNIVFMTASSKLRKKSSVEQFASNFALVNIKPFKTLTAHEFFWGYHEPLLIHQPGRKDLKFGMLKTRNGTSDDVTTIFTGEDDIRKLALIDRFNGQKSMDFWSKDECNKLDGTDGSQFPPHWMDKKQPLQVFIKAFCRKFPLVYEKEVNILDGIPAWRYKAPQNVFSHPDNNTENSCYCNIQTNDCPPSGVFNASLCFNAPIFSSFPHFYTGDPILFENIEGLEPEEKKHLTYADVHPRLAFPINGASRFQINIQVQKASLITGIPDILDGQYLPVLWMEITSGELSDELRALIYHTTFSANAIQLSLRYGSLLVSATTMALLVAACYYNGKNRQFLQKTHTTK